MTLILHLMNKCFHHGHSWQRGADPPHLFFSPRNIVIPPNKNKGPSPHPVANREILPKIGSKRIQLTERCTIEEEMLAAGETF